MDYPVYKVTYSNGVTQFLIMVSQDLYNIYSAAKKSIDDKAAHKALPDYIREAVEAEYEGTKWIGQMAKKGKIVTSDSPIGKGILTGTGVLNSGMDNVGPFKFSFEFVRGDEEILIFDNE